MFDFNTQKSWLQEDYDVRKHSGMDLAWFDYNSLDRDNLRLHLERTPAQEAWLAQKLAEVKGAYLMAKQARDELYAELWIGYKSHPQQRITAKHGLVEYDASDEVAKQLVRMDPRYRAACSTYIQAKVQVDYWFGLVAPFQTKKAFVASLAGITREEIKSGLQTNYTPQLAD